MRVLLALLLFLAMLLVVPSAFAAMQVTADEEAYNIEDEISLNVTIKQDTSFKGFLRLELQCSNSSDFPFYLTPLTVEQGALQAISTALPAADSMKGECVVQALLNNGNGNTVEQQQSGKFLVTNHLSGAMHLDKDVYKAGESVYIAGQLQKASGEDFAGTIDIYFDSKHIASIPVSGRVSYELHLSEHELGGTHYIKVAAQGPNALEQELRLFVESEIKDIIVDIKEPSYNPGEIVKALLLLKDQAGVAVPGVISLDIIAPHNNWLGTFKADSNVVFTYALPQQAEPGNYTISATYNALLKEVHFTVKELKQLGFDVKDNFITITNTGNVIYDDTVELYLESTEKKYIFSKEIQLAPGASTAVELYKEVSDNTYTVTIPALGQAAAATITVQDTRTLAEKSKDTFSEFTGAVVAGGAVSYITFSIVALAFLISGYFVYRHSMRPRKSEQQKQKEQRKDEIQTMLDSLHKK